jgi:CRP-like cAMP-binding protein
MLSPYFENKQLYSEKILEEKRLHLYEKGEIIPLNSGGVWEVYRGFVELSTIAFTGEEVLLGWVKPEVFFGDYLTNLEISEARALSEVYLKWYPWTEIDSVPNLTHKVLHQIVPRIRQVQGLLAIAGMRRVEDRLMELLNLLKQEIGENTSLGVRLPIRLTHQNLANTINTTRVTITRLLGDFQRQGLIKLDENRHIVILH